MLGACKAPTSRDGRDESDRDKRGSAQEERGFRRESGRVVVRDAAILVDEGTQHPAHARRVGVLHQLTHPERKPRRVVDPDEEEARDDDHDRQREDEHWLARAHAEPHRDTARKDRKRESRDEKRRDVVPEVECATHAVVCIERIELVDPDLDNEPQAENQHNHRKGREKPRERVAHM